MNYPTDGRSIVTNLVWGILAICICGSPTEVSGQEDASTVPVRDVEELDGLTRLIWTTQMIFVPDALAHVSPLYAYNPLRLEGLTVHPDRIGAVAIVRKCRKTDNRTDWISPQGETDEQYTHSTQGISPRADGVLCANYMNDTLEAFHSAYDLASEAQTSSEGPTPGEVYFATTYPLLGIEPDKRFVAELPR